MLNVQSYRQTYTPKLSFYSNQLTNSNEVFLEEELPPIERDLSFGSILLQLIKGTSSKCISTNQSRFPSLLLVVISIFCTSSCFARPWNSPYVSKQRRDKPQASKQSNHKPSYVNFNCHKNEITIKFHAFTRPDKPVLRVISKLP